jgi:hypothetical protein
MSILESAAAREIRSLQTDFDTAIHLLSRAASVRDLHEQLLAVVVPTFIKLQTGMLYVYHPPSSIIVSDQLAGRSNNPVHHGTLDNTPVAIKRMQGDTSEHFMSSGTEALFAWYVRALDVVQVQLRRTNWFLFYTVKQKGA